MDNSYLGLEGVDDGFKSFNNTSGEGSRKNLLLLNLTVEKALFIDDICFGCDRKLN